MPSVLIIGGGPAGAGAAIVLARAGWDVTVAEQHRYPRDKVCGECLSSVGFDVLGRLGLQDGLRSAGAIPLTRSVMHAPSGASLDTPLPRPMWGLSRLRLDQLLLDAAVRAGARLLQPARCEALDVEAPERPRARIRDLTANTVQWSIADFAIIADGKASIGTPDVPTATGDFGIKAHFSNVSGPRDAIELFSAGGTYGGLAPIEGDRWNAAFSVRADVLREYAGDVDALFQRALVATNNALTRRLRSATRVGAWLAAPLPRFGVRRNWLHRVIPIGNAAAALEPIGGEGMGLALRSAELAAYALLASHGQWTTSDESRLRAAYQRLWRTRRAACRGAALAMSSSAWAEALVPVAQSSPVLVRAVAALMGKR